MDNQRLVELISKTPAEHLEIIDLAARYTRPDGELDTTALHFHPHEEIQEAKRQAIDYAKQTDELHQRLITLAKRQNHRP